MPYGLQVDLPDHFNYSQKLRGAAAKEIIASLGVHRRNALSRGLPAEIL